MPRAKLESGEPAPKGFKSEELPENIRLIRRRMLTLKGRTGEVPEILQNAQGTSVSGFEDVFDEQVGSGVYFNTGSSIFQLSFVLAHSKNPLVLKLAKQGTANGREYIKQLRDAQVLSGMKILDLGSGQRPGFAIASQALGAEVYTVDGDDLYPEMKQKLSGHVELDLNEPDATKRILDATGGNFDIVTENIIGKVGPLVTRRVEPPKRETIAKIAAPLVKKGGLIYCPDLVGSPMVLLRRIR